MVATNFSTLTDGFQFLSLFDQAFAQCAGLNGTVSSKTSAYVLKASDNGSNISLDGNAFYSLTASAANTYPVGFGCSIVNIDTLRAKWIIISGGVNFYLWPLQTCIIFTSNNNWVVVGAPRRWIIPTSKTFNVDPVSGSDTIGATDGLATGTGSFRSCMHAFDIIHSNVDANNNQLTILMASGSTDAAAMHLPYWSLTGGQGGAGITIDGGGGFITGGISTFFQQQFTLQNVTITTNSLALGRGAKVAISGGVSFGAIANNQIQLGGGSYLLIDSNYSITGGGISHMSVSNGSTLEATNLTITIPSPVVFSGAFINVQQSANVSLGGNTWTGATNVTAVAYSVTLNGVLNGIAGLPGSAGSAGSGGQAV